MEEIQQAVKTCFNKYTDFSGRAGRPEFWWFMLACFIVAFVLGLFNMNMLALLFNLAVLVPSLAVGARRLHDIGKSGWFQLLVLIPLIGWLVLLYWFVQPTAGPNEYGEGPATVEDPSAVPPGVA